MKTYENKIAELIETAKANRYKDPQKALTASRPLRDYAKEHDDLELLAFADYHMGSAYYVINDFDSCDHYINRAVENYIAVGDSEQLGYSYNIMVLNYIRNGRLTEALNAFFAAMKLVEENDLPMLGAYIYINGADLYRQLGDDEGLYHYLKLTEESLDRAENNERHHYLYLVAACETADCARRMGDTANFNKQMNIIEDLLKKHPEEENNINVMLLRMYIAHDEGDREAEEKWLEKLKNAITANVEFLDYINELMDVMEVLKQYGKHEMLEEIFASIDRNLNGTEPVGMLSRIAGFKVRYYTERADQVKENEELKKYFYYAEKLNEETNIAMTDLFKKNSQLIVSERTNERLRAIADTDTLTGLPNRRALNEKADMLFERAYHEDVNFGVEMMDIDIFKSINDTYGHSTGDDALVTVAKCLRMIADDRTFVSRYGGDEFMILYLNQTNEEIIERTEILRRSLDEEIANAGLPHFTISQGIIAHKPRTMNRVWDYTSAADAALYSAKETGRNKTVLINSLQDLDEKIAAQINNVNVFD